MCDLYRLYSNKKNDKKNKIFPVPTLPVTLPVNGLDIHKYIYFMQFNDRSARLSH